MAKKRILDSNLDILTKDFPSGEHLCKIAAKISTNWKTNYYLFKLDNSDVENITQGCNRDNPVGQRLGYEHSKYTKREIYWDCVLTGKQF